MPLLFTVYHEEKIKSIFLKKGVAISIIWVYTNIRKRERKPTGLRYKNMKAYVKVYHWNKNGTIKHDTYKFNSLEEAREYYNKKYIAKGMMKTLCKGNHEEIEKEKNY